MKRRILLLLIIFVMICSFTTACGRKNISIDSTDVLKSSPFVEIPGREDLFYHVESRTIYVIYFYTSSGDGRDYSVSVPYIQNGHYCEYIDNEIVEVTE